MDDESFELIRKQFKDRKLDLVIDYEHQTLSDVQAPAGGWIKDLYKGEDAIIAKVEWTPKAAEYLKNKEYRYLSPVVLVRKRDQKATAIHSVALTNTPAIDGMFALVNSLDIEDISEGGNIMDLKELAKALGLPETATEEEIKKAVEDAVKAAEKLKEMDGKKPGEGDGKPGDGEPKPEGADMVANSTILSMLGLKADAKTEDVAASIMALKAGAPDTQAAYSFRMYYFEYLKTDGSWITDGSHVVDAEMSPREMRWSTTFHHQHEEELLLKQRYRMQPCEEEYSIRKTLERYRMVIDYFDYLKLNGLWKLTGSRLMDAQRTEYTTKQAYSFGVEHTREFRVIWHEEHNLIFLDGTWSLDGSKIIDAWQKTEVL